MGRKSLLIGVALTALSAVACMPQPTNPGPTPPKVQSFAAAGGPFTSPALVPLAWKVSDANGDDLTCRLDWEDDGVYDLTIPDCGRQSRVKSIGEGAHAARLEVTDGTSTPVTSLALFTVDPPTTSETFSITLRQLGTISAPALAAFTAAKARWESAITVGVPDASVHLDPGECLDTEPGLTTDVDDVLITIEVTPIDGPGGILGQAGPCLIAPVDSLTREGIMQFDSADVTDLLADGSFTAVVLHEMGHVLGIGTLWDVGRDLTSGIGGTDPRYLGPRGVAEWSALGGTNNLPVEGTGGPGTAGSHWRESTFDTELMTGWLSPGGSPMSAMTISSLGDLGYHVDRTTADPYDLPLPGVHGRPGAAPVDLSGMLPTRISYL